MSESRHLTMLRQAGDYATILSVVVAALFIAVMSGLLAVGSNQASIDDDPGVRSPLATGGELVVRTDAPREVEVAQATFVRRDVVTQDRIVTVPRQGASACGPRCDVGTATTRPSRERYWSRADPASVAPADPRG